MSAIIIIALIFMVLALGELAVHGLVIFYRPKFQWITTPRDAAPAIDPDLVRKHLDAGFDADLGWVRKPGTTGTEQTESGPQQFHIDARGCRKNPGYEGRPPVVAVFGDSYAFCRLAGDMETWPYYLSRATDTNVLNFGVGNYGLDQAILRLERELPSLESEAIIMVVVPETMARIHSYWKHYYEYGNVLAFKPRFLNQDDGLRHVPPAVRSGLDYGTYAERLDEIQRLDSFYKRKFLRDVLAFPYLPKLVFRFRRHVPILWHLVIGSMSGHWDRGYRRAFDVVLRCNGNLATQMYGEPVACELFERLATRFRDLCDSAGRRCMLVILPQPFDLEAPHALASQRARFFEHLKDVLPVLDLTDFFVRHRNWRQLFVSDRLGPHLNARGNEVVAGQLLDTIRGLGVGLAPVSSTQKAYDGKYGNNA